MSVVPVMALASTADGEDLRLITSYCPDNYLDLKIQGKKLVISGVLSTGFDSPFWAAFCVNSNKAGNLSDNNTSIIKITPGKKFSTEVPLSSVTKPTSFRVYTNSKEYGTYWSYIWHSIYIEPDDAGGYRFSTSPVLKNNIEKQNYWINPGAYLSDKIPEEIQALSDKIVQDAKSDYEKALLIYKWVVENIYYDFDAYYSGSYRDTSASAVLANRRSVCEGYANLLQALLQAQGIPCIKVQTYSLGISTSGEWTDEYISTNRSNHAHNEAFVDGRWIVMDATWDSRNKYENGKYKQDTNCYLYFDITPEVLAGNHKIISRPKASKDDTPSSWAQEEVLSAIGKEFVPAALQSSYRKNITREEFCSLIMTMLCSKSGMSLNEYLRTKQIVLDKSAFADTSNEYILAANALGIVSGRGNGRFDPDAYITRQEAAVMLTRAAKTAGITAVNSNTIFFDDSHKFAPWATDSIAFVTALADSSGTRVMAGTGNNMFSPLSYYTREQSIVTVNRLDECL